MLPLSVIAAFLVHVRQHRFQVILVGNCLRHAGDGGKREGFHLPCLDVLLSNPPANAGVDQGQSHQGQPFQNGVSQV